MIFEIEGFLRACAIGDVTTVNALLRRKELDIHIVDHMGRNAIHLAVVSGNCQIIKKLLSRGVDPNLKDCLAKTPLHYSVLRCPSVKVSNLLLRNGADVPGRSNSTDPGLFMDLVILAIPNDEEEALMILLLDNGAQLEDPLAPGGRQALHYAAMSNNDKLLKILLQLGSDPSSKNHLGMTAEQMARLFDCSRAVSVFEEYRVEAYLSRRFDMKS